jgi:cysteine desulfurase
MAIYFDNSATTPIDPRVYEAMIPYFKDKYANPSSIHKLGRIIKEDINSARTRIASLINADEDEIIFTGSGSESNNLAIKGIAFARKYKGNHIITSSIEHKAVLQTCKWLENYGFEVTYLPVNKEGLINIDDLRSHIKSSTILISIMLANNEIGTLQPISEITELLKNKNIIVHTDAVQAAGKMTIDVADLGVDLLTFSGHKIYAPKGIGVLYISDFLKNEIIPLVHGGGHEFGLRAGTENVPYIIGLAKACDIIEDNLTEETRKIREMRDKFETLILKNIPGTYVNGANAPRICNISNIAFKYIEGEALMVYASDICCSTGSACTSDDGPSHVLRAMKIDPIDIHGSLRFSFGRFNNIDEVDRAVEIIKESVTKLREFSPLYDKNAY